MTLKRWTAQEAFSYFLSNPLFGSTCPIERSVPEWFDKYEYYVKQLILNKNCVPLLQKQGLLCQNQTNP